MLDMTQYAIRVASETENHMTSVERVMNYTSIEPEPGYDTGTLPPEQWPHQGALSLCDLSLAYLTDAPKVLNNINITVAPKEKVGIAGRTGAGKSSLVAALFRMPEPEGKVKLLRVFFGQLSIGRNGRCSVLFLTFAQMPHRKNMYDIHRQGSHGYRIISTNLFE